MSILDIPGFVDLLCETLKPEVEPVVARRILQLLVNLSAEETACGKLVQMKECDKIVVKVSRVVADPLSEFSDLAVSFLVNVSRREETCQGVIVVMGDAVTLSQLIEVFVQPSYNRKGQTLDMLAHVFGNITQVKEVRRYNHESF
jgi:hypothetical protein